VNSGRKGRLLFWFFLCIPLLFSCGETKDKVEWRDSSADIDEAEIRKEVFLLPRQDPQCSLENAPDKLGTQVKLWVYKSEEPSQIQVDMTLFSGKGIKSTLVKGVNTGAKGEKTGPSSFSQFSQGTAIPICRVNGGYDLNSVENSGLLLAYITHQTMHLNRLFDVSAHPRPIQIYLQPLFVKRSTGSVFLDNALHVGSHAELFFLPHSTPYLQQRGFSKIPYYHNWMTIAHEIGHNVVHNLVLVGKEKKRSQSRAVFIIALDEALADLFADYYWSEAHFIMSKGRNVALFMTEEGVPKKIDSDVIQSLASGALDPHVMGSYLAYGFNQMMNFGNRKNNTLLKIQFLFTYFRNLREAKWKDAGADFLFQSIEVFGGQIAAEQGSLSESQCEVVREVFPSFVAADPASMESWGCSL
jgi:hypothetical protein